MNSKGNIDRNASRQDTTDSQHPPVNLSAGQHLHGFEVKAITPIDELRAVAIELAHQQSGARLIHLSETVFGLPEFRMSEMLLKRFDESYEELSDHIEQIRDFLLVRGRVTASFTGSDAAFAVIQGQFAEWINNMRDAPITAAPIGFKSFDTPPREGLAVPIQIAHCIQVMPAPYYSHIDSVLLTIGSHILTFDYMLPEIRLKGNAYNCFFHITHWNP